MGENINHVESWALVGCQEHWIVPTVYVQQRTLEHFDLPIHTVEIGINYVILQTFFGSVI